MNIGFSTGSLAKGDFRFAIKVLSKSNANVVELSALRESELEDFSLHGVFIAKLVAEYETPRH